MAALLLASFLEALDDLIVTTALPRIAGTLRGFDRYTWADRLLPERHGRARHAAPSITVNHSV